MYRWFYCIPNLQPDRGLVIDGQDLGSVFHAHCHIVLVRELAFDVAVYEAGLSNAFVSGQVPWSPSTIILKFMWSSISNIDSLYFVIMRLAEGRL